MELATHDDTAYVLNARQQVWSSTDLVNWHERATVRLPPGEVALRLAVTDRDIYVGTTGRTCTELQSLSTTTSPHHRIATCTL